MSANRIGTKWWQPGNSGSNVGGGSGFATSFSMLVGSGAPYGGVSGSTIRFTAESGLSRLRDLVAQLERGEVVVEAMFEESLQMGRASSIVVRIQATDPQAVFVPIDTGTVEPVVLKPVEAPQPTPQEAARKRRQMPKVIID